MNIEECFFCDAPLSTYCDKAFHGQRKIYWVTCGACFAAGPMKDTKKGAITAWNDVARIVREAREAEK